MASNSHAGELPRRKHTTFRTRQKFEIKNKIIFHQDSAPAHKSVLTKGKLRGLHYELLEHPPYSQDLAPSDLSLPKTQTLPRSSAFFFKSRGDCGCRGVFCRSYYRDRIMALEHCWNKCISLKVDYIEK